MKVESRRVRKRVRKSSREKTWVMQLLFMCLRAQRSSHRSAVHEGGGSAGGSIDPAVQVLDTWRELFARGVGMGLQCIRGVGHALGMGLRLDIEIRAGERGAHRSCQFGQAGDGLVGIRQAIDQRDKARRLHDAIASMSPAVLQYRSLSTVRDPLLDWLARRAAH